MLLLTVLIWTVWTNSVSEYVDEEGKQVSKSYSDTVADPKNNFPTYDACMKEIEKQLDWMEQQGFVKRISKYETQRDAPVRMTTRWECRESK